MASYRPQNLYDLTGRVAIVTGGGTGIGLMIAQGLAASGAKVYITGRRLEVLKKVADGWDKNVGGQILPYDIIYWAVKALLSKLCRLQMDVTNKESISQAKSIIEAQEGKLHILVNKCAGFGSPIYILLTCTLISISAGQVGPESPFLGNPAAPERKNAETLGQSLFNNESFEGWADLYSINVSAIFFVTTAFLGLLAKGSEDIKGHWSSVINITSISGLIKVAQEHVRCFVHVTYQLIGIFL